MVVNSRSLMYLSSDDWEEPITPSHLLIGRLIRSLLEISEENENQLEVTWKLLNKRMTHLHNMINHFWRRWKTEYFLELRDVHRHQGKGKRGEKIAVGDVVVIHSDAKKRGSWSLGRVVERLRGKDGQIREQLCRLKIVDSNKFISTFVPT